MASGRWLSDTVTCREFLQRETRAVRVSPRDHGIKHGSNRLAFGGQCVLHAQHRAGDDRAVDEAVDFEVPKGFGEHLVGDAVVESLQLVEVARAASEFVKDSKAPLAADRVECGGQGARQIAWCRGGCGHHTNGRAPAAPGYAPQSAFFTGSSPRSMLCR